jgi:hypothetical protein
VNPETHGPALVRICIAFSILILLLVTARIYARTFITRALGLDDLFCVISMVSSPSLYNTSMKTEDPSLQVLAIAVAVLVIICN